MDDDPSLLRRYVEGSDAAFTELVHRHVDLVYSVALRRTGGDAHRSTDVVQQVFASVAQDAKKLSRHPILSAWLHAATRNVAVNIMVSEQRRKRREEEAHEMHTLTATNSHDAEWASVRPVLDDVMDQLTEVDRAAVILRFFERRNFADIGAKLRLTEDAARVRVERALDKLHRLLARRGVTSTTAALATVLTNEAIATAPSGLAASVASAALGGTLAGASTTAAIFFGLMSATKTTIAVAVVAVGVGLYCAGEASRAAERVASLDSEAATHRSRLHDFQARITATAAANHVEATSSAAGATDPNAVPETKEAKLSAERELIADAAFNEMLLRRKESELGYLNRMFYRELRLTPEQIAKVESLISEATTDAHRLRVAARLQGADDDATGNLLAQEETAFDEKMRAIIGEDGLQRYWDHMRTWGAEELIRQVASKLYFTDSPLTGDQGSQLKAILVGHSPDFKTGDYAEALDATIDWAGVTADAARFLSPRQLAAMRGLQAEADYQRQLKVAMNTAARKTP